jgi:hypothetical protein
VLRAFRFVRGLELRIQELEEQLALARRSGENGPVSSDNGTIPMDADEIDATDRSSNVAIYPLGANGVNLHPAQVGSSPQSEHEPPLSLAGELRILSLEATADRHLGSSSGLSFARLTQAILRRLTPDRADFVFRNHADPDGQHHIDFNSPADLLDPSIFYSTNNLNFWYPPLFGNVSLSDIMEPIGSLTHLALPDQEHVNRLVSFYFAHSHTLYPIIRRTEFMSVLNQIYENPQDPLATNPLVLFRIWIVLAIGSSSYCSISMTEESESMLYYNKALEYFEPALAYGDMVCVKH